MERKRSCEISRGAIIGASLLCLISLLLFCSLQAFGDSQSDTLIRQRQQELDQMKTRIESLRSEITKLRQEGQDIELILTELERKRSVATSYIRTIDVQLEALQSDISAREVVLKQAEAEIQKKQVGLRQALVLYYKTGRVNTAELLVSSKTFGELFARAHYWARTIKNIRGMIQQVSEEGELIKADLSEIESRRQVVIENRGEKSNQLREMATEEKRRMQDRTQLAAMIATYEDQSRKLLASQKRIEQMLAEERSKTAPGVAGAGLASLKGGLDWPVKGKIVTRFGTHIHPKYGTRVRQQGVEIAAGEGTAIKSVAPGQIVFAGWLEGYGNTVIVDHGKDFFSLYGHASELLVERDQAVERAQVIGRVGSTDSLKGANLHFEIRRKSEALNPVHWLKR